jgi:hypothetical protein
MYLPQVRGPVTEVEFPQTFRAYDNGMARVLWKH